MADPTSTTDVDVVMACYTAERWTSIVAALESIRAQRLRPHRVIVGVDNNEALAHRLTAEFDWLTVALNDGDRGASSTRNRAVDLATSPITAFLDDDEIAVPDWLEELVAPFEDRGVVGTGGRYRDVWTVRKPDWFPAEFAWVVGGAYEGMPTVTTDVRNVWSGNMGVRTDAFRAVGGFRSDFGKRGQSSQPEDTDLCIRMSRVDGGRWNYVPTAVIDHEVPPARSTFAFFARRCYHEGAGKALMSTNFDDAAVIGTERSYVVHTALAALRRLTTTDRTSVLQGLAMFSGLGCAAIGYGVGLVRCAVTRSAPVGVPLEPRYERAVDGAA